MNFSNTKSNQRDAVNTNTRGTQFMNREGFQPSTLLFGYWNELISLKMHPALEQSAQTDGKVFNYEVVVNTAITLEKAAVLVDRIEKDIIPAYQEGKETFRGVPVGGDSLIGVGVKKVNDDYAAYFGIFKSLDETTKKPETAIFYEFKTTYTVDNYNHETGDFSVTQGIPSELMVFLGLLKAAQVGLSNATAHATRNVDRYFRDKLTNQLEEIGGKLGIAPKQKSWGGNSYGNRNKDVFSSKAAAGGNSSDMGGGSNAEVGSLKNLDDIEDFMK